MKIYKVFYKDGGEAKGLTIKVSDHGKIKIISNKELALEQLVRGGRIPKGPVSDAGPRLKKDGTPMKRMGRPRKNPFVVPAGASVSDTTATVAQVEELSPPIDPVVEKPADDADIVNVGDAIKFTLNGEQTDGEVTKEYPETQELEVKIKGGLKLVIPAAWFVRKI